MNRPADIELPFFAYGLFRPGQLGFLRLSDLVSKTRGQVRVRGDLLLRDGLPIIDPNGSRDVAGALISFRPRFAAEAYDRIVSLEPDKHYYWSEADASGTRANVMVGKSPEKGSMLCEDEEWDGWQDPLLTAALEVVEETLQAQGEFQSSLRPLFRLQMAYLLLWSAIERYASLRYHLGDKVVDKIKRIADEPAFAEGLRQNVKEPRSVYRADRPGYRETLDRESPGGSIDYYYQVRSNITHRGKAAVQDHEIVMESLRELLQIFRGVLKAAKSDAEYSMGRPSRS